MTPVTVTVDPSRFDGNPVHLGLHLLNNLRDSGVPVVGVLWPVGVESGTLTVGEVDMCDGTIEWTWAP